MNYETTKRIKMRCYPSLYYDEIDVLCALFFVNGNGYEWKGGELVDRYYGHLKPESIVKKIRRERKRHYLYQLADAKREKNNRLVKSIKKDLEVLTWPAKKQREYERRIDEKINKEFKLDEDTHIYPICQYAGIANIPDDVKPDWLDAAKRAIVLAKDGKCGKLREEDKDWLRRAEGRIAIIERQNENQ